MTLGQRSVARSNTSNKFCENPECYCGDFGKVFAVPLEYSRIVNCYNRLDCNTSKFYYREALSKIDLSTSGARAIFTESQVGGLKKILDELAEFC